MNLYAYVGNSPLNWIDPSGETCTDVAVVVSDGAGGFEVTGDFTYQCSFGGSNSGVNGVLGGFSGAVAGGNGGGGKPDKGTTVSEVVVEGKSPCTHYSRILENLASTADMIGNGLKVGGIVGGVGLGVANFLQPETIALDPAAIEILGSSVVLGGTLTNFASTIRAYEAGGISRAVLTALLVNVTDKLAGVPVNAIPGLRNFREQATSLLGSATELVTGSEDECS